MSRRSRAELKEIATIFAEAIYREIVLPAIKESRKDIPPHVPIRENRINHMALHKKYLVQIKHWLTSNEIMHEIIEPSDSDFASIFFHSNEDLALGEKMLHTAKEQMK